MRSGYFYNLQADKTNKAYLQRRQVNGFRYIQALFIAGIMLVSMAVNGAPVPVTTPTFVNGSPQAETICANGSMDITALLAVNDLQTGKTETWTLVDNFGCSVSGLPATAPSGGSSIDPTTSVSITATGGPAFVVIMVSDGEGGTDNTTIVFTVNPQPAVTLGANPAVCAGVTSASISFSGLTNVGPDTVNFLAPGNATSWTVPQGITSLNFDVQGARGGRDNVSEVPNPGYGGRVQGMLAVAGGEVLNMFVGGVGGDGTLTGAVGGYNGGGNTSLYIYGSGGAGGGASDIRVGGVALTNRVVVAGGGGGNGWDLPGALAGGAGGGLIGGNSAMNGGSGFASGGTQLAGGAGATFGAMPAGMDGSLGVGGDGSVAGISGGGGGGYYGGGGGLWTGGGGGSSYTDAGLASSVVNTQGYDTSGGRISVNYIIPGTYSIVWDDAAHTAGFTDVVAAALPTSPFPIVIPSMTSSVSAVFTATLTVSNTTCTSQNYPIAVTVNPIPDVNPVANQPVCNGSPTTDIVFSGSDVNAAYNWTNNNTSIGLGPNGTGHIGAFTPTVATTAPVVATLTVIPTANGCTGSPQTFTITDNPVPTLSSTLVPPAICDNTVFNYTPTSATGSTVFTWSRAGVFGIENSPATGEDNPGETLDNSLNGNIPVVYQYFLNYAGCLDTENVTVIVYPQPVLTSTLTPSPICSGTIFSYTPQTNVEGTNITWSRAATTGLSNGAASGANNPDEMLIDTTAHSVVVIYVDTLNYNGCIYIQDVTVTVNPTPVLTTPLIAGATCNNTLFSYDPNSATLTTTYTWSRAEVDGISNSGTSGIGSVGETLVDTTALPVVVTYVYTLTANNCPNTQNVTDTVKPTPTLSSSLTPDSVCSNTVFTYLALSGTPGTTFAWVRDSVANISNFADSNNTNPVSEILVNTSPNMVPVTYKYMLAAEGCLDTENVVVKVEPTPLLNNNPSVDSTCDNVAFVYTPTSATVGSTYSWTRAYVPGIDDIGSSGIGGVNEALNNTTYVNVDVTYHFIITANGCSNPEDVVLTVRPNPTLSSDTTGIVCSSGVFNYNPTSYTPTTTFAWSRTNVPGITPATNSGIGFLSDTLTSSLSTDTSVVYVFTLTAYSCSNTEDVTLLVHAAPAVPGITTFPPDSLCDNTMYQNFGTSFAPAAGMEYNWLASNADVYAMGENNQYCIINFTTPGTATIYLVVNNVATNCINNDPYIVNVSNTLNSSPKVIYVNGQFICQANNEDHYQWGYDDATTLDSTLIAGETNQNYANTNPDPTKYYWVMISNGDCIQKSYYIVPGSTTGVADINAGQDIKVYPNPATESINVDIQSTTAVGGNYRIEVLNTLGQVINSITTTEHNTKIDVAGLAAGCYFVDCYHDGVKTGTAKFIKN